LKKIVVDTGVVVSGLLKKDGTSRISLELVFTKCIPLLSIDTLHELNEVLGRPKFASLFSPKDKLAILDLMLEKGVFVEVISQVTICRDKNDNMFLNLAIDGAADAILSRDADLLVLNPFQKTPILHPGDFILWLEEATKNGS
jgi:uncharacterized protein